MDEVTDHCDLKSEIVIGRKKFHYVGSLQHHVLLCLIFGLSFLLKIASGNEIEINNFFLQNMIKKYSDHSVISKIQLQNILHQISGPVGKRTDNRTEEYRELDQFSSLISSQRVNSCFYKLDINNLNLTNSSVQSCLLSECLNASQLLALYNQPENGAGINATELLQMIGPVLLYQAESGNCRKVVESVPEKTEPSKAEVWGYGILFVTIINSSSLVGVAVVPFMKRRIYHVVLMFLVALAVGVLCGSSLLFLIPDALGLNEIEVIKDEYPWKAMSVVSGIYLFFLIERLLRIIIDARDKRARELEPNSAESVGEGSVLAIVGSQGDRGLDAEPIVAYVKPDRELTTSQEMLSLMEMPQIAPVAWMIIFGDGLHNFIDGLAIGASFTDSTLAGISISVAVMCEEFPHELGDFAVLLKSGMTVKKAVLFNFLSACCCYAGLAIGILLGELTAASRFIFAVAGGMFLYLSLVDMMPELNYMHAEEVKPLIGKKGAFVVQNLGLSIGFGLMLLLAIYGGEIDFTT